MLFEQAEAIAAGVDDHIELESKNCDVNRNSAHCCAKHMIARINNQAFIDSITQNQTIELLKEYKRQNLGSVAETQKLEQVNFMTPENIHLNSFMYEPPRHGIMRQHIPRNSF